MTETDFKIGDKIYHASNSSIHWIIEKIEGNEAYCSTLLKDTFEQKKEKFTLTSIKKYKPQTLSGRNITKRNNY